METNITTAPRRRQPRLDRLPEILAPTASQADVVRHIASKLVCLLKPTNGREARIIEELKRGEWKNFRIGAAKTAVLLRMIERSDSMHA